MITENPQEEAFIEKIDGNFPFSDHDACLELMREAVSISPKACFQVIKEIGCIEDFNRESTSEADLNLLIDAIKDKFEHPMKELVIKAARKLIAKEELSLNETMTGLEELKKYQDLYPVLSILCLANYDESLDNQWDEVAAVWDSKYE
ncbi:MAG: hypothetical protein K0Q95_961 [Bacteroidota bacterium]|jgi:hypothetical protein|nr:hypothetical protein [Bacteroidota bacterium]